MPNSARPIIKETGEPVDILMSPLSVFRRMNFGQINEGLISRFIDLFKQAILSGNKKEIFKKAKQLLKITLIIRENNKDDYYLTLKHMFKDKSLFIELIEDTHDGLPFFYMAPAFSSFQNDKVFRYLKSINASPIQTVVFNNELLHYVSNIKLNFPETIEYPNIFCSKIYIMKLMQLSDKKLNSRDFGSYKKTTMQPAKNSNLKNKGSKLGSMEMDAFISAGCENAILEFRTLKSDFISLKINLINRYIKNCEYVLPNDLKGENSYTKKTINSMIKFLNE